MPWIEVDEPHAKPPKLPRFTPGRLWDGPLAVDRGWAEFEGVTVERDVEPELSGCSELTIGASALTGQNLATDVPLSIECFNSAIVDCDLSRSTVRAIRGSRFEGCKFSGADLSQAALTDVVFERCSFRYTNLRMAKLKRVQFNECHFDDVDGFEMEAVDVNFDGSQLDKLNIDRITATRVDFRGATELVRSGVSRREGCLVAEEQLPALAYGLALAANLDIERTTIAD